MLHVPVRAHTSQAGDGCRCAAVAAKTAAFREHVLSARGKCAPLAVTLRTQQEQLQLRERRACQLSELGQPRDNLNPGRLTQASTWNPLTGKRALGKVRSISPTVSSEQRLPTWYRTVQEMHVQEMHAESRGWHREGFC